MPWSPRSVKTVIAGRDDPHVDAAAVQAAYGADFTVLQDAEQLRLRVQRQLAHLVQE